MEFPQTPCIYCFALRAKSITCPRKLNKSRIDLSRQISQCQAPENITVEFLQEIHES